MSATKLSNTSRVQLATLQYSRMKLIFLTLLLAEAALGQDQTSMPEMPEGVEEEFFSKLAPILMKMAQAKEEVRDKQTFSKRLMLCCCFFFSSCP